MTSRLAAALEALYGAERRRDRLGLDGTRALMNALGHPERAFRAVHVAGTNGKGSTCALIERVLRVAGLRTGLYTSPHLVDFRERIRVDGRWADAEWLEATLDRIAVIPGGAERTFFEVATALGFAWLAERRVEWGVIEVGLGGRLDCTNVVEPAVSVVTTIGLDHTEILGATLESIAAEKAGIARPGVPMVAADAAGPAGTVLRAAAAANGAPFVAAADAAPVRRVGPATFEADTRAWGRLELECGLAGMPAINASCALAALDALAAAGVPIAAGHVREGFVAARWPGRFERSAAEPRLWWDGAHNPQGVGALATAWRTAALAPPAAIVLAVSRDKDVAAMLAPLAALAPGARVIATRSRSERALEPGAIARAAAAAGLAAEEAPDVAEACGRALALGSPGGLVLVTGSLFAVGEAMERFGGAPGEWL